MKTKIYRIPVKITLFALVFGAVVLAVAAAPALAGPMHVVDLPQIQDSVLGDLVHSGDLDRLREILDAVEDSAADEGPFPDGGDWEPVFPDDGDDEAVPAEEPDEACDEAVDEPAAEEPGEACDEPADEAIDDGDDEICEEEVGDAEAVDEPAEEVTDEEPLEEEPAVGEEADELPFTGGDSTPWLIVGAGVMVAGIALAFGFGRRSRNADR